MQKYILLNLPFSWGALSRAPQTPPRMQARGHASTRTRGRNRCFAHARSMGLLYNILNLYQFKILMAAHTHENTRARTK